MATKAPADSAQMQRKTAVIDDIKARLESADAAVLTEYRGLTVTDIANLRAALRPAATDYKIFKNTLARRAAHDAGLDELADSLEGPVAIAFVRRDGGDAVTAAKALRDFARTNPQPGVEGRDPGPSAPHESAMSRPWPTCRPASSCSPGWPAASRPRWSRRPACSRRSPGTWRTASRP